jgi:carboxyl-terminal processing protease
MLPSSNRGVGTNIGFPDVCLTPAGPAVVPIPYPNLAMNAQATAFSIIVKTTMMNALNMGTMISMTSGMEGGAAHPLLKQMGKYTMGNPIVFIEKLPGICLLCPTTGNNMNNPIGAVLVPSATTVFFTYQPDGTVLPPAELEQGSQEHLVSLTEALEQVQVQSELLDATTAWVHWNIFSDESHRQLSNLFESYRQQAIQTVILDIRNNPGGDLQAAIRLADEFLERGETIVHLLDGDGDEAPVKAKMGDPHTFQLFLLINQKTASASEVFAAALQTHHRACLVGEVSYGKATSQQLVPNPEGGMDYVTTTSCSDHRGNSWHQVGLLPDLSAVQLGLPREQLAKILSQLPSAASDPENRTVAQWLTHVWESK